MKLKLSDVLCGIAVLAVAALAVYVYPLVSDPMPTHWNAQGVADGYTSKPLGVGIMIALPMLIYAVLKVLPLISPRGFDMHRFQKVTDIIVAAVTITTAAIASIALLSASGSDLPMSTLSTVLIGSLFVVLGNYLGEVRKNFFIGIRTPWTLASDEVWARTHRLGGRLFFVAGIVVIASAVDPTTFPAVPLTAIGVAAAVSVIYSLVLYIKLYGINDGK